VSKEIYLPVETAGLTFKNPFYVSSGPTARTLKQLTAIEKAGWGGASLKLSIDPKPYINLPPRYAILKHYNALAFTAEKRLTYDEGRRLMSEGKKATGEIILMANMAYAGGDGPEGWARMAKGFEDAGADAVELNMCCPNMSFNIQTTAGGGEAGVAGMERPCAGQGGGAAGVAGVERSCAGQGAESGMSQSGASIGQDAGLVAEVTRAVKNAVKIPVIVKLTPEGGMIGKVAKAAYMAGADAVSGTGNRLGMPPINLEEPESAVYRLQKEISIGCFGGGWLKPLAQRDTYEIRKACGPGLPVFATGGVASAADALEMAMCGADMVGVCTATLTRGYGFIGGVITEAARWLNEHGHNSFRDIRDKAAVAVTAAPDLTIYKGHAVYIDERQSGCGAGCGICADICPDSAIQVNNSGEVSIDANSCSACGICSYRCPNGNIGMYNAAL